MIKIRYGVFETNSSSTHSLCIAQNDEIDKLQRNELLVNLTWDQKGYLISYEDALKKLEETINEYHYEEDREILNSGNQEEIYRLLYEYDIAERLDYYLQSEYLESYEESFTTKNGDRILIFGRYGHD